MPPFFHSLKTTSEPEQANAARAARSERSKSRLDAPLPLSSSSPSSSSRGSHEPTRVLGLGLLSLVSEEFVRPDSPLPDVRKKELRASLVWAMPSVLHVLAEVSLRRFLRASVSRRTVHTGWLLDVREGVD